MHRQVARRTKLVKIFEDEGGIPTWLIDGSYTSTAEERGPGVQTLRGFVGGGREESRRENMLNRQMGHVGGGEGMLKCVFSRFGCALQVSRKTGLDGGVVRRRGEMGGGFDGRLVVTP